MKVKALKSFCGLVNMTRGQEKEIDDSFVDDLVRAGYIEVIGSKKAKTAEVQEEAEAEAEEKPATKTTRGRKKNNA